MLGVSWQTLPLSSARFNLVLATGLLALGTSLAYILTWFELERGGNVPSPFLLLQRVCEVDYNFPLGVSIITTTVIAVVRCCYVTMPLTVQKSITARRQLAAILVSSALYMGIILWVIPRAQANCDCGDLKLFINRKELVVWGVIRISLPVSCFTVIFVSKLFLLAA